MNPEEKYTRRRLRSAYLTTVISLTLVLLMLGLLGIILLHARKLSVHVKENLGFTVYFHQKSREAEILKLQKVLDTSAFVRSTRYISAEEAADNLKEELGEDFLGFLGYNPLQPSIDVKLRAEFAVPDSMNRISENLRKNVMVSQVDYQRDMISQVNHNIKRIGLVISAISILLLLISVGLINNTIRLAVYSKRFIIRSMMLVGATRGFIRRPFIWQGILQGIISALLSSGLLAMMLYYVYREIPELFSFGQWDLAGMVFVALILAGAFISGISNHLAVTRYLNMKIDNLYL